MQAESGQLHSMIDVINTNITNVAAVVAIHSMELHTLSRKVDKKLWSQLGCGCSPLLALFLELTRLIHSLGESLPGGRPAHYF